MANDAAVALRELAINATRDPDPAAARYFVACRFDPAEPEDQAQLSIETDQADLWQTDLGSSWR